MLSTVKMDNRASDPDRCRMEMDQKLKESACVGAWELALGFAPSLVTKAACELGIPDMLARDQPLTAKQIAERLQVHYSDSMAAQFDNDAIAGIDRQQRVETRAELVERMMRFLSARGVFAAEAGHSANVYALNALSAWLVQSGNPTSLHSFFLFQNSQEMMAPWHHLSQTILAANLDHVTPFNLAHGTDVWGLASENVPFGHLLDAAMSSCSHLSLQAFLANYSGFDGEVNTLVDVGGGTGTSASYIAACYPSLKVINFDLPRVVASAPAYPGVKHIGGNMFDAIPQGDAIFMKFVLHDWGDEDCIKILKNCYKALPAHGKVIIVEAIVEDASIQKSPFHDLRVTLDLTMLAHTTYGKERTREQWKCMLQAANFCGLSFHDISSAHCIIEALPCGGA